MEIKFRWIFFLTLMITVMSLGLFYIYKRLTPSLTSITHRRVLSLFLFCFLVYEISVPILNRTMDLPIDHPMMLILNWTNYFGLGFFALLFFSLNLLDITKLLDQTASQPTRRIFLSQFFPAGILASTGLLSGVGLWQARWGLRIEKKQISMRGLPTSLDGLKIVQITDLHVGPTIQKGYVQTVVEMANAQSPDIIAVTGDMVDGNVSSLMDQVAPLSQLRSKYGVFYVTGNHEYYWGAQQWIEHAQKLGMIPLLNEHRVLDIQGAKLLVAGVTDVSQPDSSPAQAIQGGPTDIIKILLAHQPKSSEAAKKAGIDLQLSGHTHAGQFFPWSLLVKLVHTFYQGLYRTEKMWIYVGRGTGYWGPPIRLGVFPELGLLELVAEKPKSTV